MQVGKLRSLGQPGERQHYRIKKPEAYRLFIARKVKSEFEYNLNLDDEKESEYNDSDSYQEGEEDESKQGNVPQYNTNHTNLKHTYIKAQASNINMHNPVLPQNDNSNAPARQRQINKYAKELKKLLHFKQIKLISIARKKLSQEISSYKNEKVGKLVHKLSDLLFMPPCIEHTIKKLVCFLDLMLIYKKNSGKIEPIVLSDKSKVVVTEKQIGALYTLLQQQREKHPEKLRLKNLFDKSEKEVRVKKWDAAKNALEEMLRKVQPLDIPETIYLVQKANEVAYLIKKQHVILFMGSTGAGKSTTIHFLAGSEMVSRIKNGLSHISPINVTDEDLKKIITSPIYVPGQLGIRKGKIDYAIN